MASETQTSERSATPARKRHPESRIAVSGNRGVKVVRSCTIRKPASELYQFWRSLENLERVIKHPVSITRLSETESHWKVTAPGNTFVEWDSVIINDHPNELLAWRSKEGADLANAGTVRFEP